jgi:formate transporter
VHVPWRWLLTLKKIPLKYHTLVIGTLLAAVQHIGVDACVSALGEGHCKGKEPTMDYVKPVDVAAMMVETGRRKLALAPVDLLIRGALAGAILASATSLAITGTVQTGQPLVGALIFPVGLTLIVLLGLDLVTGSFGLLPLPLLDSDKGAGAMVVNWGWVFVGNLIGSVIYGGLLAITLTNMGASPVAGIAAKIVTIAEAKTLGYAAFGLAGMVTVFVKAILCNWMVCLAIVAAMTSNSTVGKIATAWMPVFIFFAQGFEHSVVNMFLIPTGMMLGAKISLFDWWFWNQIPVTLGNLVGGFTFTGLAIYLTHKARGKEALPMAARVPAE